MKELSTRFPDLRFALIREWLVNPGGSEEVFRQIHEMVDGPVFTSIYNPAKFPWLSRSDVRASRVSKMPGALTRHYIYSPIMPRVYRSFDLAPFDVILSDSHSFAHHALKRRGALHICYYHTPARALWAPQVDDRAQGMLKKVVASRLKALDLRASKNPDVILANSQTIADRIEQVYGRKVDAVIYPPVEAAKYIDVERINDSDGLLYWGRLVPYKRVDIAIEAAIAVGAKLNIVGSGPDENRLRRLAEGHSEITFHGRLSDDDLKRLMSKAKAVVFPAYEDFGIVPVEAMAAGLPVIAFGKGGAKETVTPEFGVQFDEQSPACLAQAIRELDKRKFDPVALRTHALKFDVSVFRSRYLEAASRAIEEHLEK